MFRKDPTERLLIRPIQLPDKPQRFHKFKSARLTEYFTMGIRMKTLIRAPRALSLVSMLCFTLFFVVHRDPLVSNNQIWQRRTSWIYVWTGNLKINLNKQQKAFNNSWFKNNRKSRLWQLFEPEVSCLREVRVGSYGDGSKWVCDPVVLRRKK